MSKEGKPLGLLLHIRMKHSGQPPLPSVIALPGVVLGLLPGAGLGSCFRFQAGVGLEYGIEMCESWQCVKLNPSLNLCTLPSAAGLPQHHVLPPCSFPSTGLSAWREVTFTEPSGFTVARLRRAALCSQRRAQPLPFNPS